MNINEMTIEDFKALRTREFDEDIGLFNSIILMPGSGHKDELHDSGYRCMDFVAEKNNEPICLLSGCSDVVNIDGIGGVNYRKIVYPDLKIDSEWKSWSIDCLAVSGLFRLFCGGHDLKCGIAISSFELLAIERKE